MTDVKTIAQRFTDMLRDGQMEAAQNAYWSENVVSLEPEGGAHARCEGLDQLTKKHEWWDEQVLEMHSSEVLGPYVHGDQFVIRFVMDATMKDHGRVPMDELGVYTVRDGKIVEERFFYALPPTDG